MSKYILKNLKNILKNVIIINNKYFYAKISLNEKVYKERGIFL